MSHSYWQTGKPFRFMFEHESGYLDVTLLDVVLKSEDFVKM